MPPIPPKLHLRGVEGTYRGNIAAYHGARGIMLTWDVTEYFPVEIEFIEVFYYPETVGPYNPSLWRKAEPIPHTGFPQSIFKRFYPNHTYYFIVRAEGADGRYGPFSNVVRVNLQGPDPILPNHGPIRPIYAPGEDIIPPRLYLQGFPVTRQGERGVYLRWKGAEDSQANIAFIQVFCKWEKDGRYIIPWTLLKRAAHTTFPRNAFFTLPVNATYHFIAKAENFNGRFGPYSNRIWVDLKEM